MRYQSVTWTVITSIDHRSLSPCLKFYWHLRSFKVFTTEKILSQKEKWLYNKHECSPRLRRLLGFKRWSILVVQRYILPLWHESQGFLSHRTSYSDSDFLKVVFSIVLFDTNHTQPRLKSSTFDEGLLTHGRLSTKWEKPLNLSQGVQYWSHPIVRSVEVSTTWLVEGLSNSSFD